MIISQKDTMSVIEMLKRSGERVEVGAGEALAHYPDSPINSYCYFLEEGVCALIRYTLEGNENIYSYLMAGELIGFFSYFGMPFRDAEARHIILCTRTDCILYRIPQATFNKLLDTEPLFVKYLLQVVCRKYSEMNYRIYELKDKPVPQQICGLLLTCVEERGGRQVIPRYLTYGEISRYLGVHEITVTRVFGGFFREMLLTKEGKTVIIPDLRRLREFYESGATIRY